MADRRVCPWRASLAEPLRERVYAATQLALQQRTRYFLCPGSVLHATLKAGGEFFVGMSVEGYGMLSGEEMTRLGGHNANVSPHGIHITHAVNTSLNGVTVVDMANHHLIVGAGAAGAAGAAGETRCRHKVKFSCCPLRPRTTPFPEEKSILGVTHRVLLWTDMNAATPLGARGRFVISSAPPCVPGHMSNLKVRKLHEQSQGEEIT